MVVVGKRGAGCLIRARLLGCVGFGVAVRASVVRTGAWCLGW